MAENWHKSAVFQRGNDYDFVCKFTPPDEAKPDRILTYGYVSEEWLSFGEFRSSCNREVRTMTDHWTDLNSAEAVDVTEDFEEAE